MAMSSTSKASFSRCSAPRSEPIKGGKCWPNDRPGIGITLDTWRS